MATTKQKQAAHENIKRARQVQNARAHGEKIPTTHQGMSTAEENRLADSAFAFPKERKEPLSDAAHVRNAIARFNQVEGVNDAEREEAWKRILAAARSLASGCPRAIGEICFEVAKPRSTEKRGMSSARTVREG